MKKNNIPIISIVGRTNVGKSALFNKIANNKRALVYDQSGITRDPILDEASWKGYSFQIVDTAGFLQKKQSQKNNIEILRNLLT